MMYHTRWHKMAQDGTRWHKMAQDGTRWHKMAQDGTRWHIVNSHSIIKSQISQIIALGMCF